MGQLPLNRSPATRVLGVVLAAGLGRRMGRPKAELVVDGERLLDRAVRVLAEGGCDGVIAVVPPGVRPAEGFTGIAVENPDAESGMRSSLLLATDVAAEVDGLAVTLVDTPGIGAIAVRDVLTAWLDRPDRIAVATYDGRRRHPIVMSVSRWHEAHAAAGPDEGARAYLLAHPDQIDEIAVAGDPADLDTPEDVKRWLGRPNG